MKHPQPHVPSLLGGLPLFRDLDVEQVAYLASAARERCYGKGEVVFRIGDQPTGFFIVTAGLVKEACMSALGKERILELFDTSQSFGESALFLNAPYPYSAVALTNTRLLHVDKAAFFDVALSQPKLVSYLLQLLSKRTLVLLRDIESHVTHRHIQRTACYLIGRCDDSPANQVNITLPASKLVIASRLGMTPETLSRNLHDLVDAGLITVRGNRIRICNLARLKLFAV